MPRQYGFRLILHPAGGMQEPIGAVERQRWNGIGMVETAVVAGFVSVESAKVRHSFSSVKASIRR
jgi:hypothetical protein